MEAPVEMNNNEEKQSDDDQLADITKLSSDRYISDAIEIEILPEKKGVFWKHTEYRIKSENYKSFVDRRYNDFVILNEVLLRTYEFRMIPRLPPKQFMIDAFLEERRAGLQRYLTLISQHSILAKAEILKIFLTAHDFPPSPLPIDDEFEQCVYAVKLGRFNSVDDIITKREQIRKIVNKLMALKRLIAKQLRIRSNQRQDYGEMSEILSAIASGTTHAADFDDYSRNFREIAKVSDPTESESGVTERLELLNDALTAFNDLCDRVIARKQMTLYEDKSLNTFRLKHIIRSNFEEELDQIALQKRRVAFGIFCAFEEFKLVQKYLTLLPSILLKFSFAESKFFSDTSHILRNIIDIESDKLNS